ncbi:MAG: Ni/Fe hydrogenase subunit alpha [Candidatus Zipacnadales bacterium]
MAHQDLDINIENVTRIEGHGDIVVNVTNGKLETCELRITESPRFFEAMLRGRPWQDAVHITCRICGICSTGHTMASVRAMENALGITPSEQTMLLRRVLLHGETLQSHYLHVLFLAAPDFLGVGSVFPLVATHPDVVKMALRLKRLSNDVCHVIGGRHIMPISVRAGGFTKIPPADELAKLRERLAASMADVNRCAEIFSTFKNPELEREMEFVALTDPGMYPFLKGKVKSSYGTVVDEMNYRDLITEHVELHSTSKHASTKDGPYMVGALARYNINHEWLRPESKAVADLLGLKPGCQSSFFNNQAQIVEIVECTLDAIDLIDKLLERGLDYDDVVGATLDAVEWKPGRGAAAVEVPRGILFHDYTVGEDGLITDANLIIPTGQNYGSIEADMRTLVPTILDKPRDEIALTLEMLVRAYDPCISCSVHLLDVKFVE